VFNTKIAKDAKEEIGTVFGGSTLKLCYVVMSKDGRFWLHDKCWGAADATDMVDARIYRWRWAAESDLKEINEPASV